MRQIEVCVGSSCFLKGAYPVLDAFLALMRRHGLEAEVSVTGAFCKEHCRQGVSVEVDGQIYSVGDAAAACALFRQLFLEDSETTP